MKKYNILFLVLFLIVEVLPAQVNAPIINFVSITHDFGVIKEQDGIVSHNFEFTNTGSTPLIVNRVATTCGCSETIWPKEPVAPGAKATINAKYNPSGRPGPFNQRLTVFSNASSTGTVLTIRGRVNPKPPTIEDQFRRRIGDIGVSNSHLSVGKVVFDQVRTDTLKVYNFGSNPVKLSFDRLPPHISIAPKPETLKPQEQGIVLVTFDAEKVSEWGFVIHRVRMQLNNENHQGNLISISANIEEDFSGLSDEDLLKSPQIQFSETNKDFGNVNEGEVIEHEFIFKNTGKSDLIIRKVKASCGCTTAAPKVNTIKPGEESSLSASFKTQGFTGRQTKTITVISNDPKSPTTVLRLSGTVTKN